VSELIRRGQRTSHLLQFAALFIMAVAINTTAQAWDRGNLADYHERRARLVGSTRGGIVALFGYDEADIAASVTTFHQNEEFYYLTGWNEPGAMMLLVPKAAAPNQPQGLEEEILYVPPRDPLLEKWNGPRLDPQDPAAPGQTGFATVRSTSLFHSDLLAALKKFPRIYTELTPQLESGEDCFQQDEVGKLRKLAPLATLSDIRPILQSMRSVKSAGEIGLMRRAADNSVEAHLAAMKAVRPGAWEYEISALMKYEFDRRGSEWPSYPPIVGSGFFSEVLHYDADDRQMQAGDLVVLDVAGSYGGYASDVTRTLPVNGHFSARQREIYDIVLGAQRAAIAAAKPGVMLRQGRNSLHQLALDYIDAHGKDLHGQSLGQYFIHGLGHSVGLNVHDPMDYDRPLEPGMVVTMEPGIYIPEEKFGVRIEDVIVITKDGNEVLTERLPSDPDQIEKIMAAR
jgi:Xaa-Pro aminopeptidase